MNTGHSSTWLHDGFNTTVYKYALAFGPTSWQLTSWKRELVCQEEGLHLDIHVEDERNYDKICLSSCAVEKSGGFSLEIHITGLRSLCILLPVFFLPKINLSLKPSFHVEKPRWWLWWKGPLWILMVVRSAAPSPRGCSSIQ